MDRSLLKQNPFFLDDEDIKWVEKTLEGMTREEKAGHLFCISPQGLERETIVEQLKLKPCGLMLR